jgi:alanine dehydrogenase
MSRAGETFMTVFGDYPKHGAESVSPPSFVTADVVENLLTWESIISSLAQAYAVEQSSDAVPPRVVARSNGAWLRVLAAIPSGSRYMGTKVFGLTTGRKVNYVVTLFDQETGTIAGFVDGNFVTARRTAGTSAVAVDRLAPIEPAIVAVLGSGAEARAHLEAIATIRSLQSVRVFSPTQARREDFATSLSKKLGVRIQPVAAPKEAVEGASLVIAAARSSDESPILLGSWLRPNAVVVSIGSTLPEQREIDVSVVEACDLIVCDAVEEVCHETGDMIAARAAGIKFDHKLASLTALVSGKLSWAQVTSGRRMFKSVGTALQDIVVAGIAFDRARELRQDLPLPGDFYLKRV